MQTLKYIVLSFVIIVIIFSFNGFCQKTEIWGATTPGGYFNDGSIFKTDSVGENLEVVISLNDQQSGPWRSSLCENNNKLYGVTSSGGLHGKGTIFEYDPSTEKHTIKFHFGEEESEAIPSSGLINGSDGILYGTTNRGGKYDKGMIFSFSPSNSKFEKIFEFDGDKGANPEYELVEVEKKFLFGTTKKGGKYNHGVIYKLDKNTQEFKIIYDFEHKENGIIPEGKLLVSSFSSENKIFGITSRGGKNDRGVLFEINLTSNKYKPLIHIDYEDMPFPEGGLIEVEGKLYGTVASGGEFGRGAIFEYDISEIKFNTIYSFGEDDRNGVLPKGRLFHKEGILYGSGVGVRSGNDGDWNYGMLFEFNLKTRTYIKRYSCEDEIEGHTPNGSLSIANNGNLYGIMVNGGKNKLGTIFEYNIRSNSYRKKHDFEAIKNGSHPLSQLIQGCDGNIYGVGFNPNNLIIFSVNPKTKKYSKRFELTNPKLGDSPESGLLLTDNCTFLGTCSYGGKKENSGVIYEYHPNTNEYEVIYEFSKTKGYLPVNNLVKGNNSMVYGVTLRGGATDQGVIYQFNYKTGKYLELFEFDSDFPSTNRYQGLTFVKDEGKLFGLIRNKISSHEGILFSFDLNTSKMNIIRRFEYRDEKYGSSPSGPLIQAKNNLLYGLVSKGGANHFGGIFEFNPKNDDYKLIYSVKDIPEGGGPNGTLLEANNGNFYGTSAGGIDQGGVIFEYDYINGIYKKKHDFIAGSARDPSIHKLIEISACNEYVRIDTMVCDYFVSPSGKILDQEGFFLDTTINTQGCKNIYRIRVGINKIDTSVTNLTSSLKSNADSLNTSFQWLDCDNNFKLLPGENRIHFKPTRTGSYAVKLNNNLCIDTSGCHNINVFNINEKTILPEAIIYPNPTNGKFKILGKNIQIETLIIRDETGRIIQNIDNKTQPYFTGKEGVYYLQINLHDGFTLHRRLIKINN